MYRDRSRVYDWNQYRLWTNSVESNVNIDVVRTIGRPLMATRHPVCHRAEFAVCVKLLKLELSICYLLDGTVCPRVRFQSTDSGGEQWDFCGNVAYCMPWCQFFHLRYLKDIDVLHVSYKFSRWCIALASRWPINLCGPRKRSPLTATNQSSLASCLATYAALLALWHLLGPARN